MDSAHGVCLCAPRCARIVTHKQSPHALLLTEALAEGRKDMESELFKEVLEVLSSAKKGKAWMTVKYIAKKINQPENSNKIEQELIHYLERTADNNSEPMIRYSSLPSRKSLEVLWGAVDRIGTRRLESITQDHIADDSLDDLGDIENADVFVSHSHRDYYLSLIHI